MGDKRNWIVVIGQIELCLIDQANVAPVDLKQTKQNNFLSQHNRLDSLINSEQKVYFCKSIS